MTAASIGSIPRVGTAGFRLDAAVGTGTPGAPLVAADPGRRHGVYVKCNTVGGLIFIALTVGALSAASTASDGPYIVHQAPGGASDNIVNILDYVFIPTTGDVWVKSNSGTLIVQAVYG